MCEFESLSRGRRGGRLTDLSNYLYKGLVDMELKFYMHHNSSLAWEDIDSTTFSMWSGDIQWNLLIRTSRFVLCREVVLFQR